LITNDPETIMKIQHIQGALMNSYGKFSTWKWMNLRHILLNYLQDRKTRVSIFLKKELQGDSGSFHIDLQKPLDDGVMLPKLQVYNFQFRSKEDVILLGSNIFNETKQSSADQRMGRVGLLGPLHGLLIKQNSKQVKQPVKDTTAPPLQWETLQLSLTRSNAGKADVLQVEADEGETLLDLFDQSVTFHQCLTGGVKKKQTNAI